MMLNTTPEDMVNIFQECFEEKYAHLDLSKNSKGRYTNELTYSHWIAYTDGWGRCAEHIMFVMQMPSADALKKFSA